MPLRSAGYTHEEDRLLCQVYMKISQDPIKCVYQSFDQFWSRVAAAYENGKDASWSERTKKSIHCRIQTTEKETKKLHACIKQCENRRPSGASNDDIFKEAKLMLLDDPKYKGGWKFDHVWSIIKNFEKFKEGDTSTRNVSNSCGFGDTNPELENVTSDSATQESPDLSTFSMNLDDEKD
ncbi:hypothetical protein F2Q69_00014905 [Brassica cretica]|uniref:No apical meristem-associated C-terminal domain-containing protein n=1 Tax=Brassica cretica TaxID=69181 RepID=A0A8S9QUQ7_BRACR|nr:hypothetical protein F2Q69_00014905 [Brassica cretica]